MGRFHFIPESLVRYRASTLSEQLRIRQRGAFEYGDSVSAWDRLGWCIASDDYFLELVTKRYGKKMQGLSQWLTAQKKDLLLMLARLAMHDGDRRLAQRATSFY